MELHIKQFLYRNIQKRQEKINLAIIMLVFGCLGAVFSAFSYDYSQVIIGLEIIAVILTIKLFIKVKKNKKQRENLSYDLVKIDEFNKFFYQNIVFDMTDLESFIITGETTHLYFKDYYLFIENSEGMIDYLKKFTPKGYDQQMNPKNYFVNVMLSVGYLLIVKNIFDILFGFVYCQMTGAVLFDYIGLAGHMIEIMILLLVVVVAVILAKKYHKSWHLPLYLLGLILYIAIPFILDNHVTALNDNITYVRNNNSIMVYSDVKNFFGKNVVTLKNIDDNAQIFIYEDIIYIMSDGKLQTYDLKNETYDVSDITNQYNNHYFKVYINDNRCVFAIKNNEFYFGEDNGEELKKIEVSMIGKNIISFQYQNLYYFVNFQQIDSYHNAYIEFYRVDEQHGQSVDVYEGEYVEQSVEEKLTYEEILEKEAKEKEELYQQRYDDYLEVIKQDDATNYQSTKNVVKVVSDETDIYKVIKAVDQEITRINNEEDVTLDVQIGSMQIYYQNGNEYGIYISTSVDRNGERGYGYSETILMKKYGNVYIATRVDNSYMPNTHLTNHEIYNTSATTDYLYRVEGNESVPNVW